MQLHLHSQILASIVHCNARYLQLLNCARARRVQQVARALEATRMHVHIPRLAPLCRVHRHYVRVPATQGRVRHTYSHVNALNTCFALTGMEGPTASQYHTFRPSQPTQTPQESKPLDSLATPGK